jgi:hypothetical protein
MIIHCFDFNSVELCEFIFNSELIRMEEDNLQKCDITCVRQFMYRERRKLFPAQPKNREILEDIGMATNKHEDFVLVNDSENGIIMLGCEQNLKFLCSDVEIFTIFFATLHSLFMVLGTDIISHLCLVCCQNNLR